MRKIQIKENVIRYTTIAIVAIVAMAFILPMVLLRGDYVFTIHDGLDSYAGVAQAIYENKSFFHMNAGQSFSGGLNNYYKVFSYNLYDLSNCLFGYINGRIITRIFSVIVGFFSMLALLKKLFGQDSLSKKIPFYLISVAYAVTSCAPNREIAFSTLPLVVWLFLYLMDKEKISKVVFFAWVIPFFSILTSFMAFIIPLWFLAAIYLTIRRHRIQLNVFLSFIFMCVSTVLVNWNTIWISLIADDTNRSLFADSSTKTTIDFGKIRDVLLNGQYHSTPLHGYILLPLITIGSIYVFLKCVGDAKTIRRWKTEILILIFGWVYWVFSAVVSGVNFSTGITLIDGFGWARCVTIMRLIWYLMISALVSCLTDNNENEKKSNKILMVICISCSLFAIIIFSAISYSTYLDGTFLKRIMDGLRFVFLFAFMTCLFSEVNRKYVAGSICTLLLLQCAYLFVANTTYNGTGASVYAWYTGDKSDTTISLNEFFSKGLFDQIKEDIQYNYDEEWVAAYGFHPSVLIYNGFNTIDRYESLHSMRDQIEFRKIIAPALDRYPEYKDYYDTWGGRMYLFGEIGYLPSRQKYSIEETHPLYIDGEEFKHYRGKYILSRTAISNADELELKFVKAYDSEDSLYCIYLYETN